MARRAARGLNPCPPEMKQASLVKNAVSIRRDSARAVLQGASLQVSKAGLNVSENVGGDVVISPIAATINEDDMVVLSFTFDATKPG